MADKKSGGLTAFVNKHIMPVAAKIGNLKPLIAVRDGIAMAMPLIIVGSLFMIINSFPAPGWSDWLAKTAVLGLITGWIFQWFINHNIQIKMPETVPPAVAKSFSVLIPGAVVIAIAGCVYWLFTWAGWGNLHDVIMNILAKPLGALGDTLIGTLVSILLVSLFWFVGIHGGNVVNTAMSPIWLMQTDANRVLN